MKIRTGFVSNSSSSSFVVMFPDNFNPRQVTESYTTETEEQEIVIGWLNRLISAGEIWDEEMRGEDDADGTFRRILKPYTVVTMNGGPEDGRVILADRNKVKKIMGMV